MHLRRVEIQGFKTFAKKTVVEFGEAEGAVPLTVIVGPNGSGKSNLADAIRWCLGEQSLKLLRGKSSEDVIFSGAEGRGRSGFAEVTLVFENTTGKLGALAEASITRRVYRDGEAQYLLNGESVRLQDIQLLLANVGVGQRSYAVIGQGMIDHILLAPPEERKTFFDDATGVRALELERGQAARRLTRAGENLVEVRRVLAELEPRLILLRRHVRRLEEREVIEHDFAIAAKDYYGHLLATLRDERRALTTQMAEAKDAKDAAKKTVSDLEASLDALEKAHLAKEQPDNTAFMALKGEMKMARDEYAEARHAVVLAERDIELAKVRAQSSWAPLPLHDIVSRLDKLHTRHHELSTHLESGTVADTKSALDRVRDLARDVKALLDTLVAPSPQKITIDEAFETARRQTVMDLEEAEEALKELEEKERTSSPKAAELPSEVFALQRSAREAQAMYVKKQEAHHALTLEETRLMTREESLMHEMRGALAPSLAEAIAADPVRSESGGEGAEQRFQRLRRQLEAIGSIDPEVVREHKEVEERFTFLSTQVGDLMEAIEKTDTIVRDLEASIKERSTTVLKDLDRAFNQYFKTLFGGGSASLTPLFGVTEAEADTGVETIHESSLHPVPGRSALLGIEIEATPPGKRVKSLSLLSGGERALTSIALLCAIMATNPAPFVVLDEVDAALDDANTVRFARILKELTKQTQFIVITHNRATMEEADILYGVTMASDGISKLVSVKFEEIDENASARR